MRGNTPSRFAEAMHTMRPAVLELLTSNSVVGRAFARRATFAAVFFMLALFGSEMLWASTDTVPSGLIVRRSTRAAPHRLIVHPSAATIGVNQTQQFGVTDPQGNPVAVRWNVSGIGCSGVACGTIDDKGIYQPPSSLPQPRIVTVEGVLVSNPNYSVLAEIRLGDPIPDSAQTAARKMQEVADPVIPRQVISKPGSDRTASDGTVFVPLPNPVTSAPAIGRQRIPTTAGAPPLPTVIAAAPEVRSRSIIHSEALPPLPHAVAASPQVERENVLRSAGVPALPNVINAAPEVGRQVGRQSATRKTESMPLSVAIGAAPELEKQSPVRQSPASGDVAPLPHVVAAMPEVEKQIVARNSGLPPLQNAVVAAPEIHKQNEVHVPPRPNVIAAAPAEKKHGRGRDEELVLMPGAVISAPMATQRNVGGSAKPSTPPQVVAAVDPAAGRIFPGKSPGESQQIVSPTVSATASPTSRRESLAAKAVLPQMQDLTAAAAAGANKPTQPHSTSVVTYVNGQLTINAENLSLATVLQMVAEKTGATIEVPPGTGQERIFEHAGPGRAEDVLASLLNGSSFDFVIVGSPLGPGMPAQVLLSLHREDNSEPVVAQTPKPATLATWTPPTETSSVVLPADLDSKNLVPPKEPLSPEALGQMMKDRAQQLRDRLQQQQ